MRSHVDACIIVNGFSIKVVLVVHIVCGSEKVNFIVNFELVLMEFMVTNYHVTTLYLFPPF